MLRGGARREGALAGEDEPVDIYIEREAVETSQAPDSPAKVLPDLPGMLSF